MNFFTDMVTYAYGGSGKYVLFLFALLSVVAHLVGFAPLVGIIATVLLAGYFVPVISK